MNRQLSYNNNHCQPELGKKVQNFVYHYADLIGRGNFAKVYRGRNILTQESIAIKLISLDQLKCQHLESLVFEEIKILQQMSHPNILKFTEALLSERNCYIITELCNGGNLEERLKIGNPISEQELGRTILDIWHGMRYMREKGVVHRDLKPANIFSHSGKLKIADFGLAKCHRQRFHDLDVGSPQYMSPEGIILNCYSDKTDIWALGIIVYELIHGETPFIFCKSQNELRYYICKPIPQQRWRKDTNPLIRQFINRCLEVDQFKRPNVYELAGEPYLRDLLKRQGQIQEGRANGNSIYPLQFLPSEQPNGNQKNYIPGQIVGRRSVSALDGANCYNNITVNHFEYTPPKTVAQREIKTTFKQSNGHINHKDNIRYSFSKSNKNENSHLDLSLHPSSYPQIFHQRPLTQLPDKTHNLTKISSFPIHPPNGLIYKKEPEQVWSPLLGRNTQLESQFSQRTLETNQSEEDRRTTASNQRTITFI